MGERIKAARLAMDLTQAELGKRLKVNQQLVARWETGDTNPKLHHLVALVGALGVSADQLLGIEPVPALPSTTEAAIMADQSISTEARRALLKSYRAALSLPGASS